MYCYSKKYSFIVLKFFCSFVTIFQAFVFSVVKKVMEEHQRDIIGTKSVEEIYYDRKSFSEEFFIAASKSLIDKGIMILSYTIKDITDDIGYLKAVGEARQSGLSIKESGKQARMLTFPKIENLQSIDS